MTRLSLVTPSFNQASFLELTIRSVLGQDYPDLEYVVMDGGSTDGSADIIRHYEDRLAYWQCKPDGGQGRAIIEGWKRCSGDYVGWLNSDDVLLAGALARVAEAATEKPDVIFGDELGFDEHDRIIRYTIFAHWPRWMFRYGLLSVGQPGTFVRRSLAEQVGFFDGSLVCAMEYDLEMRLHNASARLRYVPRPLAALRKHSQTKTSNLGETFEREKAIIYKQSVRGPFRHALLRKPARRAVEKLSKARYFAPRRLPDLRRRIAYERQRPEIRSLLRLSEEPRL